ncbi:MAG: hypothetical protein SH856_07665 [Flavobacteriales bacterium]|nr:hypothetical protein [Flavobacteriales bacterium]
MRIELQCISLMILNGIFSGCSNSPVAKKSEGIIIYQLSLPYVKENLLANLYPKEMVLEFDENHTHSTIQSIADMGRTEFITSNIGFSIGYFLKDFDSTYIMELDSAHVVAMLNDFPQVRFEKTNETETICGFLCKKTLAHFVNDSLPAVTLLHTDEIKIVNPNWYTQFSAMNDVLLAYDVEQFGLRTRLQAISVEFKDVDDARFSMTESGRKISWDEMKPIMDSMLSRFEDRKESEGDQ